MIYLKNGAGEIIARYNNDGTPVADINGFTGTPILFPTTTTTTPKTTFDKVLGGITDVLKILFPTGIQKNTQFDPYNPYTAGGGPSGGGASSALSGAGWIVAIIILLFFLFRGQSKSK